MMEVDEKKSWNTKTSPNGKITTYLGKRDFLDRGTSVDLIGKLMANNCCMILLAAFRYGREDLDVLGLTFRKDLISQFYQVYPPTEPQRPCTRLQERLQKKLGPNAFPFWFEIPPNSASSVTLQPAPGDTGKPCGVDYELKTVVGNDSTDKPKKHNSVRLAIRKLTYAPMVKRPQPMIDVNKEFIISPGLLHLEASLDREMYYHGENINVNVHIQNNSNKTIKKIKVYVVQVADICIFTTASYTCDVDKIESCEGFPVGPGSTLSKVYSLCPLLSKNKDKRGLALDGQLKHEDTNLASSTMNPSLSQPVRENLGIVVMYKVKIRLMIAGALGGELSAELPFTLTHAKPADEPVEVRTSKVLDLQQQHSNDVIDLNDVDLIQLDGFSVNQEFDDDIVFEDFCRLRVRDADSETRDTDS
ncbi:Arrestin-C domain-containing protein [Aphelenchoides besseyi]|nr:Arrestin-C domain-containing protein [Aphelenchoides besseyi]